MVLCPLDLAIHLFAAGVEEGAEAAGEGGYDGDRPDVAEELEDLAEVRLRGDDRGGGEELLGGEEEGVEEIVDFRAPGAALGEVDDQGADHRDEGGGEEDRRQPPPQVGMSLGLTLDDRDHLAV